MKGDGCNFLVVAHDANPVFLEDLRRLIEGKEQVLEVSYADCASDARKAFADGPFEEVWLFSCKDMGVLNLAYAINSKVPDSDISVACDKDASELRKIRERSGICELLSTNEMWERLLSNIEALIENSRKPDFRDSSNDLLVPSEPDEPCMPDTGLGLAAVSLSEKPIVVSEKPMGVSEKPVAKRSAFVISVMSGSGGVGKSSTVATASYLAAARGFSVAVLDCDLQFGDMKQLMGDVPSTSIDDMLMDPASFCGFASSCDRDIPALICAPSRLEKSEELFSHLEEILDLCASRFDVVFVNTGSSWSEVNAQLLEKSGCNIFIVDQRSSSVRACNHALELCTRMGVATGQFIYALNRCERGSLFCASDIASALNGANVVELKEGGQEVEELLGMGFARDLAASRNDFTNSLDAMLTEVLP